MKKEPYLLIKDIFETENDSHLMSFKTKDGIPVWMIGKYYLMFNLLSSRVLQYKSPLRYRRVSFKMFSTLFKSFFHNLHNKKLKKNREIVLYSVNRKTLIDGKFFNRYVDFFAEAFKDQSYVIEQPILDWEWPFERKNENVYFDGIAKVNSELLGSVFKRKYYSVVSDMIDYYFKRVKNILGIEFTSKEVKNIKLYISKQVYIMRYMTKWIAKQLTNKTKIILMVGAAFPHSYPINVMLKKRGIISVELQHGYITSTNVMYNYANEVLKCDEIKAGMPDFMFTYGEWWNTQTNCPLKKIAIGNPYHDYCFKDLQSNENQKIITVLGCNQNTEQYVKLTQFLSKNIQNYKIVFRPHPGESDEAKRISENLEYEINFDSNLDIYATLKESYMVISEVTTVLFEAIGLVKRIIVWETNYTKAFMPEHPFEKFNYIEELVGLINKPEDKNYEYTDFWSRDCIDNYKMFVKNMLIGSVGGER